MVQPELKRGDCLIFSEALRHGTLSWKEPRWERASLLVKYCPHYMAFSQGAIDTSEWETQGELSETQLQLLERAYVWQRPSL